jgi:hypothetical protein
MRQVRLVILAGTGILALCGVAVVASLLDYVSHPGVAVSHVPPVTGPAVADTSGSAPAPAPLPTTPVTAVPPDPAPSAAPAAPAQQEPVAAPASQQSDALAALVQQLQQRHKRPPHP